MARPGQAIAATLSRILLNIYPKKDVTLGTMPLSPQKNIGSKGGTSITLRKTGPRKHPETIRPVGRAKNAYVYGEGVVKAEAVNLRAAQSFVVAIQFFALAIGQIYPSTFRMAARLGCMVLLSIRSGDTRRNTVTEFTCCSIRVASRKVIYPAC